MSIKSFITDPRNDNKAHIDNPQNELHGLVVSTRDLKTYHCGDRFFTNYLGSIDMNINAGGVPHEFEELIYDEDVGTPVEWNMTQISGAVNAWVFNSTDQHYSGTVSISGTGTNDGYTAQAAPSTTNFNLSDYQYLTGYIYITSWATAGTKQVLIYAWNLSTSSIIGNSVNIGDYVNTAILNTWQKFIIPLSDMGLVNRSIDALRFQTVDIGTGLPPDFYLDLITFNGSSMPDSTSFIEYKIDADPDTYLHVKGINLTMIGEYDSTLANATMPKIPHNAFLNIPMLENGILFRVVEDDILRYRGVFRDLFDLISLTPTYIISNGYDGTYTWIKLRMDFGSTIILKPNQGYISFFIRDDLSQLHQFRCTSCCKTEDRAYERKRLR